MRNPRDFIQPIEEINPLKIKYKRYWKDVKRKCIEGYWVDGIYMTGNLYFYANLGKILLNKNGSKTKSVGSPDIRDVEWKKSYIFTEARGFSGFELDDKYTCSRWVDSINKAPDEEDEENGIPSKKQVIEDYIRRKKIKPFDVKNMNGDEFPAWNKIKFKEYVTAREYLPRKHNKDLGKPLYYNNAKNVFDLEARRMGKSYFAAVGLILHNFLFDGAVDYDEYLNALKNKEPVSSETVVGAIDAKYTKDLLSKVQLALDNLPGGGTFNDTYYKCPLDKQTRGTFAPGKYVEAAYDVKTKGGWVTKGSKSKIHNRSFADNPLAGNGTGPNLVVFEEVGFMNNLKASLGAMKDATYNGTDKFGVIWMTGTGGEGDSASISEPKDVFYNPDQYDCLVFEDEWEQAPNGIGYFVPYDYRLDDYRDEYGNIDLVASRKEITRKRNTLNKSRDTKALYDEMQNNPIVPSEAFLVESTNIFPVAELKAHLNWVKSKNTADIEGQCGELTWERDNPKPVWGTTNHKPCWFGMSNRDDITGCIQIWEHPKGKPPYCLYVAGVDPYAQDEAPSSVSLGSTIIYKTMDINNPGVSHQPVAEYTGRPKTALEYYENVRKLLIYYNADCLYENNINNMMLYFRQKNALNLLAKQPTIIKALETTTVQRQYGLMMNTQVKKDIEIILRDWLLEESGENVLNLHKIYSVPILEELINYNKDGNFDRVIALMLCIVQKHQQHRIKVNSKPKREIDPFFSRKFYR